MNNVPTTPEEVQAEITELLETISSTSVKGRALHLLDQLNALNTGSADVSAPSSTVKLGSFISTDNLAGIEANQVFVDNTKLVISNQVGSDVSERMPFDFIALQRDNDFYFILVGSMDGFDFSVILDSYSLHSGYAVEDEFTYVGHNTMIPPIPAGTSLEVYAVPKPKGSISLGAGALAFDLKITQPSSSSAEAFQATIPSDGYAAFNDADTSGASIIYIKGVDSSWSDFVKFDGRGLYGGSSTLVIELYQNGELFDQIIGTGSAGSSEDIGTGIKALMFSNRASVNGLTINPSNGAIEARVFITYG